jgi:hypothetical protein
MHSDKHLKAAQSALQQNEPLHDMVTQGNAKCIHETCQSSPSKSLYLESLELGLACRTVHGVLYERLKLHAYRLHLVQKMTWTDQDLREESALEMVSCIRQDRTYLSKFVF